MADKVCAAACDAAELAAVDQLADVLQAAAEEGVRRASDQQALFPGERDQLLALFIGHGERLFRVYMLARLERREVVFIVRLRGGQVEDEVDIRVGDDLRARGIGLGDAVLRGFALRLFQSARGARHDLDRIVFFQVIEVYVADIADTDDANANFFHKAAAPLRAVRMGIAFVHSNVSVCFVSKLKHIKTGKSIEKALQFAAPVLVIFMGAAARNRVRSAAQRWWT